MTDWQFKLDLKDIWNRYDASGEEKMSIQELSCEVAKRLRKLELPEEFKARANKLASRFERIKQVESFDKVLAALYDLADTQLPTPLGLMQRRLMWVATF